MPARKPQDLHTRHSTKSETEKRKAEEELLRSRRSLPLEPARLKDHPKAAAVWRRMLREFDSLEAVVITRLDMDLLIDYCMLMEQLEEMDVLRAGAMTLCETMMHGVEELKAQKEWIEAAKMASKASDVMGGIIKIDGRADRKRDLLTKLRQSLYLTPRARAGAAPKEKEAPEVPDEFEKLLDESVSEYAKNGGSGDGR